MCLLSLYIVFNTLNSFNFLYSQARVQSLLRIVAEQNDLHPSLTSLKSFTSHLDVEDEVYQNYTKREQSLAGNEDKRL